MANFEGKFEGAEAEEIKKKINNEGWDENAALFIGKEEEVSNLVEKLETEGNTKDLATYLRLHKEILLSIDDVEMQNLINERQDIVEQIRPGLLVDLRGGENKMAFDLKYIDSLKNVASSNVELYRISDYKDEHEKSKKLLKDLSDLGFFGLVYYNNRWERVGSESNLSQEEMFEEHKDLDRGLYSEIYRMLKGKKQRLEKEITEKNQKEFNF